MYIKGLFPKLVNSCNLEIIDIKDDWKYAICQTPNFFLFTLAQAMFNRLQFFTGKVAYYY